MGRVVVDKSLESQIERFVNPPHLGFLSRIGVLQDVWPAQFYIPDREPGRERLYGLWVLAMSTRPNAEKAMAAAIEKLTHRLDADLHPKATLCVGTQINQPPAGCPVFLGHRFSGHKLYDLIALLGAR